MLRLFFSTDHKVIALLYGFTSLFFLLIGFILVTWVEGGVLADAWLAQEAALLR